MSEIVLYPDKVLRQKAAEVKKLSKKTLKQIGELRQILVSSENGAGLAANQIRVTKRFLGLKSKGGEVEVFINPRLSKKKGKRVYSLVVDDEGNRDSFLEGCLSFPNLFGEVKRYLNIEVEWEEVKGKKLVKRRQKLEGFKAIVWQHELDHLDGIVFIDHIKKAGGKMYRLAGEERVEVDVKEVFKEKS